MLVARGHNSDSTTNPSSSPSPSARSTGLAPPTSLRSRAMAILSPRSTNYERLEGGMGPSRMGSKRFAWKKFAVAAGVLIAIVWFFGPRESRTFSWTPTKGTDVGEFPIGYTSGAFMLIYVVQELE